MGGELGSSSMAVPQVELMDLLGEEGIQNLPLLERLQHLDREAERNGHLSDEIQ